MAIDPHQRSELKRAYEVLNLPVTASALAIKRAYRSMVKRWHPDRYPPGTVAYAEANQMMKIINESYTAIETAPLRYYDDRFAPAPPATEEWHREPYVAPSRVPRPQDLRRERNTPPRVNWWEFWVRFICGAVFGVFLELSYAPNYSTSATVAMGVAGLLIFAFVFAVTGDNFWRRGFLRIWRWW